MGNEWSGTAKPGEAEQAAASEQPQQQQQERPLPRALVIVGPSGVGKNALISRITAGSTSFGHSVSHTTRQPRAGERHGEHYFFTTKEQFAKEIAEDKFIEYAEVHGNLYGTSVPGFVWAGSP